MHSNVLNILCALDTDIQIKHYEEDDNQLVSLFSEAITE